LLTVYKYQLRHRDGVKCMLFQIVNDTRARPCTSIISAVRHTLSRATYSAPRDGTLTVTSHQAERILLPGKADFLYARTTTCPPSYVTGRSCRPCRTTCRLFRPASVSEVTVTHFAASVLLAVSGVSIVSEGPPPPGLMAENGHMHS
jgi:hypothetical protein